jgi:hypothetical protein
MILKASWKALQGAVDACPVCRADPAFNACLPQDARPWPPAVEGRLLLLSEAPPTVGGFWHLPTGEHPEAPDDLRGQLFRLLALRSPRFDCDPHTRGSLEAFFTARFFLLQTLKWPLAKPPGKRRATFNHLTKPTQQRLLGHTVLEHLKAEISVLKPRGVLAMGNAALGACRLLAAPGLLPKGGVQTLRTLYDLNFDISGVRTPLNVTFLPVDENMRKPLRAPLIEADVAKFLDRHAWSPDEQGPTGNGSVRQDRREAK